MRILRQRLPWLRGSRGDRLGVGASHRRSSEIGTLVRMIAQYNNPVEARRQTIQAALDARRSARDRNRLGQFATPNSLAVEIACYVQSIAGRSLHSIRFSDPSIGTGSFYSAALNRLRSRTDRARDRCGVRSRLLRGCPQSLGWN